MRESLLHRGQALALAIREADVARQIGRAHV